MLDAAIAFTAQTPIQASVRSIRRSALHAHPGVLEIIYVLDGRLTVDVSFEHFTLEAGDFLVVNHSDPHVMDADGDNVTAIIHIDLRSFLDVDPHLETVIFACESFDLARYCNEEGALRQLLLDLLSDCLRGPSALNEHTARLTRDLLTALVRSYGLENYYRRDREPTPAQRQVFHTMVGYLVDNVHRRDLLARLASRQNYSKSRASHLIKDVSAISFTDLVTYLRVSRAERLLLTTNATMLDIAAGCGFSDVKYLTRSFSDWFGQSPHQYRLGQRPLMTRSCDQSAVSTATVERLIDTHQRRDGGTISQPRLSITPLLLKNVGSRMQLFSVRPPEANLTPRQRLWHEQAAPAIRRRRDHLVPVEIDTSADPRSLAHALSSFDHLAASPCLVVRYTSATAVRDHLRTLHEGLRAIGRQPPPMWLVYSALRDRESVDELVAMAHAELAFDLQPILMP
ncbi:AraC family transcriptional regulator [Mycolicibacterium sp. 018/SC-01/001]|uniref:AraC family transcriptional regulator n=1 Tax=Mycolicibacterium sp. 018/SC-01/001 TaxID=2592069 RepID=UPI00117CDE07|nr:helix-turn-helix domain-containing protein [Mycolicibacterium sp. 018/SC-01/001]TRW80978.1 AraC family transcriptional regulator [Mycolicibacterium sp. 018/SC-01/001]